jgi:hypothetical protein
VEIRTDDLAASARAALEQQTRSAQPIDGSGTSTRRAIPRPPLAGPRVAAGVDLPEAGQTPSGSRMDTTEAP